MCYMVEATDIFATAQPGAPTLFPSSRIIYDLCGGTGSWSDPYTKAGYDVRVIDVKNGGDVRLLQRSDELIHGILAAPPCTVFASSGARWERSDDDMREALAVVDACIRIAYIANPQWWVLENPIGTLVRWLGKPTMYFQPCDYGDPWTKRTALWGRFTEPMRNPVEPKPGGFPGWKNLGGKSERTKTLRSITPPGFAQAFFEANQ